MKSLWEQTWERPNFSAQDGDLNTDMLIIGGGMAGVLCAYKLHCAGVPYVLVEAETVCSGITKNTTAKITSQHGLIYDKLISRFGIEQAKQYLSANEAALQTYRELCRNIDCGFEEKAAYTYSLDDVLRKRRPTPILWTTGVRLSVSSKHWINWAFRLNLWTSSRFLFTLPVRSGSPIRRSSIRCNSSPALLKACTFMSTPECGSSWAPRP